MKSMLFRSIGVSLLLLSLSLFAFADGEMGTGSKTNPGSGGGSAPISTVEETNIDSTIDSQANVTDSGYLDWLLEIFANVGVS